MSYSFERLPQLEDKRGKLPSKGSYKRRSTSLKDCDRAWHHSLTKKHLAGSVAEAFARYHVSLGWPGVGYHLIIEPKNIVNTPKGPRAKIVYANDVTLSTYHVGNSNGRAVGICVAGDYRTDQLDDATKASIDELQEALIKDGIGKEDKSHNDFPGYSWKACCVYNYKEAFKFLDNKQPTTLPNSYKIQEGDTFWGIANNLDCVTVEDLIAANPGVEPTRLKVGQIINLGKAKNAYTPKPETPKKPQEHYRFPVPQVNLVRGSKGTAVKQLQRALNAIYFRPGAIDGSYGPATEDAVRRFQMVYLPYDVDGKFGPQTRKKLQAVLKSKGY
ncbi:peptidoglycan-binding protein [Bacillus nitroreducens]